MFGRNTPPDQKPDGASSSPPIQPKPMQQPSAQNSVAPRTSASASGSVIGTDLSIVGQKINVVSQSLVRIDGTIEANVDGRQVIVGESGKVTGSITANSIEIRGTVDGAVNASAVSLLQTARVEGDINHQTLTIAEGAQFDGRVRRPEDPAILEPNLDVEALSQAAKS